MVRTVDFIIRLYELILPSSLIALLARFAVAVTFWKSAMTKVDGTEVFKIVDVPFKFPTGIKDSTYTLFEYEYNVPIIPSDTAAVFATFGELLFPILLLIGLASRFSATALLGMTLVIQIFVYPNAYLLHSLWMVALLYVMAYGPGVFSIDHFLRRHFMHG